MPVNLASSGSCTGHTQRGHHSKHTIPHVCACREGVHRNFGLVHTAVAQLGRVPEMLSPGDALDGGLEDQAVIL